MTVKEFKDFIKEFDISDDTILIMYDDFSKEHTPIDSDTNEYCIGFLVEHKSNSFFVSNDEIPDIDIPNIRKTKKAILLQT